MNSQQYAVLQEWQAFKKSAADNTPEALAYKALEKWATYEAGGALSPDRPMREALSASVAGASIVDDAILKLAAEGRYTQEEADFLLALNAESALGDMRRMLKTALSFGELARSPVVRGGVLGTAIGAGLGAWKDDDNRLRGAVAGAVPGGVLGALGGHAYQGHVSMKADVERVARKAQEAETAAAQAAQQTQAHAAEAALRAQAQAAESAAQAKQTAARWHTDLLRAADIEQQDPNNHPGLLNLLNIHKDKIIDHATRNPGKLHPDVLYAAGLDVQRFKNIMRDAKFLHEQGA